MVSSKSFKDNKRTTAQANDYNRVTSVCHAKFVITVSVTWVLMYIVIPIQQLSLRLLLLFNLFNVFHAQEAWLIGWRKKTCPHPVSYNHHILFLGNTLQTKMLVKLKHIWLCFHGVQNSMALNLHSKSNVLFEAWKSLIVLVMKGGVK